MSEIICPCCGAASPEEAYYCMGCAEPIRCKSCGAGILANARACIQCGALTPGRDSEERRIVGGSPLPPGYNRLTVHEKDQSYSYDADFVFSDTFGQQAATGGVIAHLGGFGARAPVSRPVPRDPALTRDMVTIDEQSPEVPQLSPGANGHANPPSAPLAKPALMSDAPATLDHAVRITFSEHDGKLTLQVADLKALTQKDYTLRLVHAFLFARQVLFGEATTQRAQVYEVTDFAGLTRENVSSYLSQDNMVARDGDTFSLKIGGLEHARKCLLEIADPATTGQWMPSGESRAAPKPRKSAKRGESEAAGVQVTTLMERPETQALMEDISHGVLADAPVIDKTIVALYGLNRAGVEGEVFSSVIEEYLYRVFHIKVDANSISKALSRALAQHSKYVVHKEGAGYRITPSGIDFVDETYRAKGGASPTA